MALQWFKSVVEEAWEAKPGFDIILRIEQGYSLKKWSIIIKDSEFCSGSTLRLEDAKVEVEAALQRFAERILETLEEAREDIDKSQDETIDEWTRTFLQKIDKAHKAAGNSTLRFGPAKNE